MRTFHIFAHGMRTFDVFAISYWLGRKRPWSVGQLFVVRVNIFSVLGNASSAYHGQHFGNRESLPG